MNVKPMTHISAKNNNIVLTPNQLDFGAGQRQFKSFCVFCATERARKVTYT
jgi:hypothetical protein